MQSFFDHARRSVFGGRLSQSQVDGINSILAHTADLPVSHRAYILATVVRETGGKMQPINEIWGPTAAQRGYEGRADIGNTQKGDGFKYRGRGYVQITGRRNYQDWATRLGLPLIDEPELALEPEIAMRILVDGMKLGTFTGKKLSDYLPGSYVQARRIVNGLDHATEIARNAEEFEEALRLPETVALPLEPIASPLPAPEPEKPEPVIIEADATSASGEPLKDMPTNRTSRKVEYSSKAGGIGAAAGVIVGQVVFNILPADYQGLANMDTICEVIGAGVVGWIAALQLGRRVRERIENMLPISEKSQ